MMHPLILPLWGILLGVSQAATPYVMDWSSQAYGPDGPWQAVSIQVGSDKQTVALYPGANYASTILMDTICTNKTLSSTCYAAQAGTFNQNESTTAYTTTPSSWETVYWGVQGGAIEAVLGDEVSLGSAVVPNVSFEAIYQTYQTYPNGKSYPVSVGSLAIGAPYLSDQISNSTTLNMLAGWLYSNSDIPSYSYGMHIGSVNPAIAGSLVLGGYDKSRVMGDVSAQAVSVNSASSGILELELKDIGIGVAAGPSPFSFYNESGLFLQSSGVVLAKTVQIDATKPYMYLPQSTCDAITSTLPISFNSSLGLYFWDTTSSDYLNITSSAAYLSFTFNNNGVNNQNFTIKVPFSQLNLTLQEPLVDQNTTYFPCFLSDSTPVFGRAFLQSAFVGVNWFKGNNTGTWFLAQAPGPNHASADITTINVNDGTISGSNNTWEQSWAKYWNIEVSSNSTSSHGGLSSGAKVGIGVGVGVGGAIVIAAGVWGAILLRRRRGQAAATERQTVYRGEPAKELDTKRHTQPHEMMASQEVQRYELD
ncbi:acid protease [Aspergillus sclerotioniger CBS 115572]|uniref:Acid protease n=1 Tax=Aspergillus sclerotioniger CBS 115572 TaxID=1450535 RepID=A0A317W0K0_9EURO|nr:acid protease [Aspergillus sclerotioniger CBS 115572]PWY79515.1 acid protease [Aspergillus sclerotioniger CBS 115572]